MRSAPLRSIAFLLALSTFSALPLAAQATRDTAQLPTAVVTATRLPGIRLAPTATATVLDGATLRAEGVTHVADALRRVPGLTVTRVSSAGSQVALFMRGGQSNYVRVLVDGVPVNEPGGVLDLGRVTLDEIERIEVVRGPASVLYGSEAVSGVIQLFTRRSTGQRTSAVIGAGNYGTQRLSLGTDGRAGAWAWTVQGDRHFTEGVLPFNNAYQNDGVSLSLASGGGGRGDVRITGRYNGSAYRYPTDFAGRLEDRNSERVDHRLLAGLDAGMRWSPRLETRVALSTSESSPRTNDGPDGPADTLGFYGYYSRGTVVRRLADLRTTLRTGDRGAVTLGGEFSRDTERSGDLSVSAEAEYTSSFRAARENRALYVQAVDERGPLSLQVGGRLDENSTFGTFRTVRAGAAWRLAPAVRVRASLGNAFKAPSFYENFATGWVTGNAALRPERATSAELGVEAVVGTALVRVTGFQQRFRDLIQYTGMPPAEGAPNYFNVAAANAGGVEVETTLPEILGVRGTAQYTWTDTRVADAGFDTGEAANFVAGGRLIRRPEHGASLALARGIVAGGTLSLAATYIGRREDRDFSGWPATAVELPAVTTVDLALDLPIPFTRDWHLVARADNALDARYEMIKGFASPGRLWYLGVRGTR